MTKFRVTSFAHIDEARQYYLDQVDARAEQYRAKYFTPSAGQALVYERKYQEALAGGGPRLSAEADDLGKPLEEVIASVLASRKRSEEAGDLIERQRIKAKADIRTATTPDAMHRIVSGFTFSGNHTDE